MRIATCFFAVLAAIGAAPASRDHGPIALYQPPLRSPDAAAGSELRPLVRAKLFIDAAGKVSRVEVTAIEPSSRLDEAFREAAKAGLSSWRFAAAEKSGVAVASDTSIALTFEPSSWTSDATGSGPSDRAADRSYESARYDGRSKILEMDREARRKVAESIASTAEKLLKPGQRAGARNDYFAVITDFGGQKQANALLQNVTATYVALFGLLGERVPPRPREETLVVYVFETEEQYKALVSQTQPFEGSQGFYSSAGVLAFHAQFPTTSFLLTVMLHETTHAFVDRHLVRSGVVLPRWLDEGFAEYIGNSDIKDGKLVPGGHAKRRDMGAIRGNLVFWGSPSRLRTQDAQKAQFEKRALTLADIVSAGPETFYGKDAELFYSQGWLAVHFCRHGQPEWAKGAFPRFLLYVAEGYPPDQAFRVSYDAEPKSLEQAYQKYVKSFY
jgi:hypothetical protein